MEKVRQGIKKLYTTGAFHIIAGSFGTKFVAFFGSIFVVRLLHKSEYGILQYVENLYSYALVLAGFGLPFALLRYVVISSDDKKKAYLNYSIFHSFVRDICICLFILIVNCLVVYPDNFSEAKYYVPMLAVLLPFQDLVNNDLYALRAIFKNKEYAYASCTAAILLIVGRILGAKFSGISGVIWSRVMINIVCSVVFLIFVYKMFQYSGGYKLSKQEKKDVNIYSLQYMITNGLWAIFMLNDTFLLSVLSNDPAIVADYKVAYVLPGNLSLISTAIGIYVAPYFTKNESDIDWIRKKYRLTSLLNAAAVGMLSIFLIVFAQPIIGFIYGEEYQNIVPLMRVLLFSAFLNSGFRFVTANLLSAMGKVKSNLIISLAGMTLQVILDFLFIPRYGSLGVAYSNCIVFAVMSFALFSIFYRTYYMVKP